MFARQTQSEKRKIANNKMKLSIKTGVQQGDSITKKYSYTILSWQDVANSKCTAGPISGQHVDQT